MTHVDPSPVQSPAAAAGDMWPSEALRKARQILTPEGAWTRSALARNSKGQGVSPHAEEAVCWCSFGAMEVALGYANTSMIEVFLEKVIGIDGSDEETIATWNDSKHRTHAEVLDVFDRAADLAARQEPAHAAL